MFRRIERFMLTLDRSVCLGLIRCAPIMLYFSVVQPSSKIGRDVGRAVVQAIEVLVEAALPAWVGGGEIGDRTQSRIGGGMLGEFFAVVVGHHLHHGRDRVETSDDGCAYVIGRLARKYSEESIAAFGFDHADDRLLVPLADYGSPSSNDLRQLAA